MKTTGSIFIGLGANLPSSAGPPEATCLAALGNLAAAGVGVKRRSAWYVTAPVPVSDQPWFTNAVAEVDTALDPADLLALLHEVETAYGRVRTVKNAARVLDLDLLAYGGLVQSESAPILPHPRLAERRFILAPLAEIAPGWVHPVLGLTAQTLLAQLPPDAGVVQVTEVGS